jgi:uncharacterized protein YcbX
MLIITDIYIYPVKSMGGISVMSSIVTDRGLQYDRRWMLVDENLRFISQREHADLSLLQVELKSDRLRIFHKINSGEGINIFFDEPATGTATAEIWDDTCMVNFVSDDADQWFSSMLSRKCRLVYMPDTTHRKVDEAYAINDDITSLSDGYPLTVISQASLDDLNSRLEVPVPMNRFRPNIVFSGGDPFEEDHLEHFKINGIEFFGAKLCSRCNIPTINQENALAGKEPLRTLSRYRQKNNNVYFGMNLLPQGEGKIKVGYRIEPL